MRTLAALPSTTLSQVMSPSSSRSCEFRDLSSGENLSLNSHDLEDDDYAIGTALSSPLFTQEREDAASHRQAYQILKKVCCQVSRCLSGLMLRTDTPFILPSPKKKKPQDPTVCGLICGSMCLMQRRAKQNKSGSSINQSSKMPEDYVVSSSLNLRMKN